MKKIAAALGLAALCFVAFLAPSGAQTAPSGRSIVYPLENPPSVDAVLAPARFTRLALGAWIMHALNLTAAGQGVYANCATSPGTGVYVTVAPTATGTLCGVYQVAADDATAMPVGVTPQLAADPTLIMVQALQSATSAQIGPMSPPVGNPAFSVYWLVEAQVQTSDVGSAARQFYNPINGGFASQNVNVKRQDAIAYQLVEGTGALSPTKPSVDSGWIALAYVLVPSGTTQITTGMISAGNAFNGFSTSGGVSSINGAGTVSCSPPTGDVICTGTAASGGVAIASPAPSPYATVPPPSPNVGAVAVTDTSQALRFMLSTHDPNGNNYAIGGCNSISGYDAGYAIGIYAGVNGTTSPTSGCSYSFTASINSNYVFNLGVPGTSGYMGVSEDNGSGAGYESMIGTSNGINGNVCWNDTAFASATIGTNLFRMCMLSGNPVYLFDLSGRFHSAAEMYPTAVVAQPLGANDVATPTPGDIWAARSTSTGNECIGGSVSAFCIDYGVTTSGVATLSQNIAIPSLTANQGLCTNGSKVVISCPTPGPQATPSPTAATAYGASPGLAISGAWPYTHTVTFPNNLTVSGSVGNNSGATGTTANTYATITAATGTTGVSHGANGNWLATVTAPYWVTAASTSGAYGCMVVTGATVVNTIKGNSPSACITAITNGVGGIPTFGVSTGSAFGFLSTYLGTYTIANSTAYSFTQDVASAGTTSITVLGYVNVVLTQN